MSTRTKFILLLLIFISIAAAAFIFIGVTDIAVLNPKGWVGEKERDLLWIAVLLMSIVVIPVFILLFAIGWKYRAEGKAKHTPDWDHSLLAECVWWGIPSLLLLILGIYTWKGCHELDPFRPLKAKNEIKIQVVALQWKWLFIYPEQKIASVNYVQFPKETSVHFEITSDAPMNSFWIPDLGGQIYAMSGMRSELYLIANGLGQYRGSSANISGKGFASMTFTAESTSDADFASWVNSVKEMGKNLGLQEYKQLTAPSEYNPAAFYVLGDENLFDWIIKKYM